MTSTMVEGVRFWSRDEVLTTVSPRPMLTLPRKILLAHHTGGGTWPNPRLTVLQEARRLCPETGGVAKYTDEYNYVIFGARGDEPVTVWEWAGKHRAAHCLKFNNESLGTLFCVNAVAGYVLPPEMVKAWWRLQDILKMDGQMVASPELAPHYRYRTTSCCAALATPPGAAITTPTGQGRAGELIPALRTPPVAAPTPPTPTPPGAIAMCQTTVQPGEVSWYMVARRLLGAPTGAWNAEIQKFGDQLKAANPGLLITGRALTVLGPHHPV